MAMIDARQLEDGYVIKADLCIVGAGPAGLALAKEFAQSRLRVALIESGGLDFDVDTWSLAQGSHWDSLPGAGVAVALLRRHFKSLGWKRTPA